MTPQQDARARLERALKQHVAHTVDAFELHAAARAYLDATEPASDEDLEEAAALVGRASGWLTADRPKWWGLRSSLDEAYDIIAGFVRLSVACEDKASRG